MNKRRPILLGFFLTSLAIWALITSNSFVQGALSRLDALGYDLQLITYIVATNPNPSRSIAIVDVDDHSLEIEGQWPWPRNKLAELTNKLEKNGAVVIAFDMFFSEKEPNLIDEILTKMNSNKIDTNILSYLKNHTSEFDDDKKFANSLDKSKSLLAITFLSRKQTQNELPPPLLTLSAKQARELQFYKPYGYVASIPILQTAAKNGGFINIFSDVDGIFRHAPLLIEYNNKVYPSLALQAVIIYLGTSIDLITPNYSGEQVLEGIQIGRTTVPLDKNGQALIPFIGMSYTFPYYSATDILHDKIPKSSIQGKIIFIGTSATGLGDLKSTPIQSPFPGVEIQASIANGILHNNFSYRPAWTYGANLLFTLLFGIIASITFPYMGPRSLGTIIIGFPITILIANNLLWEETGLVLSFLIPILLVLVSAILNIIWGYLFESRRREHIKAMFGQYVPAKHIDEMLKTQSGFALHGEDRNMTVLFADIRNFTSISENLSASQLVELLNTFFTPMTEIIFKNNGTIDKYVGDLIMAFWGAPLKDANHAQHAIESAISMQEKVKKLAPLLKEKSWSEIKIGIGISTGNMSVGDMGSQYRRNYTVLGDKVNLASRIESLTKFYGVTILTNDETQKNQSKFIFRKIDRVKVHGKNNIVELYEVLGRINALTPELQDELQQYNQALNAYFAQQWDEAYTLMRALRKKHHSTKIYKIYVDRIQKYKEQPLPADWDGSFVHHLK